MDNGVIPGGTRNRRKAVYSCPDMPWGTGYRQHFLKSATTSVALHENIPMRIVHSFAVAQSANGTVLVITTMRVHCHLWHASLANGLPSSLVRGGEGWTRVGEIGAGSGLPRAAVCEIPGGLPVLGPDAALIKRADSWCVPCARPGSSTIPPARLRSTHSHTQKAVVASTRLAVFLGRQLPGCRLPGNICETPGSSGSTSPRGTILEPTQTKHTHWRLSPTGAW